MFNLIQTSLLLAGSVCYAEKIVSFDVYPKSMVPGGGILPGKHRPQFQELTGFDISNAEVETMLSTNSTGN